MGAHTGKGRSAYLLTSKKAVRVWGEGWTSNKETYLTNKRRKSHPGKVESGRGKKCSEPQREKKCAVSGNNESDQTSEIRWYEKQTAPHGHSGPDQEESRKNGKKEKKKNKTKKTQKRKSGH